MAYQYSWLFKAKTTLLDEQLGYYLTRNLGWVDKGIHTFSKGISLKVNLINQLEFELAYYDVTV